MSRLADAAERLQARLAERAGRAVTLSRDGVADSEELNACPNRQDYEVLIEGVPALVVMYDWTFAASDLAALPWSIRKGDRINDSESGDVYEVLPIDKRPAVEQLDTAHKITLAHTKRVAE